MIKTKVTNKQLENHYENIVKVPYCALQYTLMYLHPIHYISGKYGWYADVYEISYNTVIVTGYNPKGNITFTDDLCKEIESKTNFLSNIITWYDIMQETVINILIKETNNQKKIMEEN